MKTKKVVRRFVLTDLVHAINAEQENGWMPIDNIVQQDLKDGTIYSQFMKKD